MCSISGFIASAPFAEAHNLCRALLYYGSVRGSQSAGIAVNNTILKRAMAPEEFGLLPEFSALFANPVSCALLHTRQPTCGGRGDDQAQPFQSGETISIHNGMISNMISLKKEFNILKPSGVDSELITSFIDTYGALELPRFLRSAYGSSAIATLYHGDLFLIRDGNPIDWITLKLENGVTLTIFASTSEILMTAIRYCWLLPIHHRSSILPISQLHRVDATGIHSIGNRIPFRTPVRTQTDDAWGNYIGRKEAPKEEPKEDPKKPKILATIYDKGKVKNFTSLKKYRKYLSYRERNRSFRVTVYRDDREIVFTDYEAWKQFTDLEKLERTARSLPRRNEGPTLPSIQPATRQEIEALTAPIHGMGLSGLYEDTHGYPAPSNTPALDYPNGDLPPSE